MNNGWLAGFILFVACAYHPVSIAQTNPWIATPSGATATGSSKANVSFRVSKHGDINSVIKWANKNVPVSGATLGRLARGVGKGVIPGASLLLALDALDWVYNQSKDRFEKPGEWDPDALPTTGSQTTSNQGIACTSNVPTPSACHGAPGVGLSAVGTIRLTAYDPDRYGACVYFTYPNVTGGYSDGRAAAEAALGGGHISEVEVSEGTANCGADGSRARRYLYRMYCATCLPLQHQQGDPVIGTDDQIGNDTAGWDGWPGAFDKSARGNTGPWRDQVTAQDGTEAGAGPVTRWGELATAKKEVEDHFADNDNDPATEPAPDPAPETPTQEEQDMDETEITDSLEFCAWAAIVCDLVRWVMGPPDVPTDVTIPVEAVGSSVTWDSGFGTGSCPAPVVAEYQGGSFTYDYAVACDVAVTFFHPFLIAVSMLTAAFIIVRG